MKQQIRTQIKINASREKIWEVLMDRNKYPEWNPFIESITGEVKRGSRIKVKLQGMTFTPTILVLDKNTEFKWLGHFMVKGLFDGEHQFQLIENGDGTVNFEQNENFSGLLVKLFSKSLKQTKIGFEKMNEALKERAEING